MPSAAYVLWTTNGGKQNHTRVQKKMRSVTGHQHAKLAITYLCIMPWYKSSEDMTAKMKLGLREKTDRRCKDSLLPGNRAGRLTQADLSENGGRDLAHDSRIVCFFAAPLFSSLIFT
jgi:hypothetical protein